VALLEDADFAANPFLVKGYIGPKALQHNGVRYLVDPRVVPGTAWVTGADKVDHHVVDLVCGRDFVPDGTIEAAEVRAGDPSPDGHGSLVVASGIEVGHIFQLGRKYADALGLDALGQDGKPKRITMGSYGIGVSRIMAAIVEQNHDDLGLVWPRQVAPADVHVVVAGKDDAVRDGAERLATDLGEAGVEVLLDDRTVSPGVKFADAELVGVPTIVVVGKGLARGVIEIKDRRSGDRVEVPVADAVSRLAETVRG
jgi:prolyl-tRNA synthetase